MLSFLSGLFTLPVLLSIVGAVIIIFILGRLLVNKPNAVKTVLRILKSAEGIIKLFMPDKWEGVYDAILAAADSVANGSFTQDEARKAARAVFENALKAANITISEAEKEIIEKVIDFVVDVIVSDKAAAKVAIASVRGEVAALKAKGLRK
jgi:hypothetical protein